MNTSILQVLRPFYGTLALMLVAVILYALLLRRCAQAIQPSRLRMADLAAQIEEGGVSKEDAAILEFSLDHAFSAWLTILTVFILPVAFVVVMVNEGLHRKRRHTDQTAMMKEFLRLSFLSTLAANPAFGIIVVMEVAVMLLTAVVIYGQEAAVRMVLTKTARNTEMASAVVSMRHAIS